MDYPKQLRPFFRWVSTGASTHCTSNKKTPITMTASSTLSEESATCDAMTVMYDGACPLCRREVALYQSLKPSAEVVWLDVSKDSAQVSPSDQARYMSRFHVRQSDGRLLSGAAAFVALWLVMPGWRWLGKMGRLPGVTPLMELVYRVFLRLRPTLRGWMLGA